MLNSFVQGQCFERALLQAFLHSMQDGNYRPAARHSQRIFLISVH